jgi:hypothetical protein
MKRGAAALLLGLVFPELTKSLQLSTRPAAKVATRTIVVPPTRPETSWPLASVAFSLLPLAAGARRKTLETTVVPGQIWTHDQLQGVVNVNVPVRGTVVKLKGGGLWVHNPVAPTPEYVGMVKALEAAHGPVKHIVLGTVRDNCGGGSSCASSAGILEDRMGACSLFLFLCLFLFIGDFSHTKTTATTTTTAAAAGQLNLACLK